MIRVLIPTNDESIIPDVAGGYASNGCEVVAGMCNMWMTSFRPDLVHFLWPEEFSRWRAPNEEEMDRIEKALRHWTSTTRTVFSVNNLYPHGLADSAAAHKLYSLFLKQVDVILHHSEASRKATLERYPQCVDCTHVVSTMFCYDRLLPPAVDREALRAEFGIQPDQFAFLVFGALRKQDELRLLTTAYSRIHSSKFTLIMAGRYNPEGGFIRRRLRAYRWNAWLRRTRAITGFGYIPDSDIYRYFEASDAVIIPRIDDLSSGVVGLAATFGRLMIAPGHGSFPDYLSKTDNLIYRSGDPTSLAEQMLFAPQVESGIIAQQNRKLADQWTWAKITETSLASVQLDPKPK